MNMIENSLMGMFVGDALGAQVEFKIPEDIKNYFERKGGFGLYNGGTFNLVKGQVTDDSEMAISLIHSLRGRETYNATSAFNWYFDWMNTHPFDYGNTTYYAIMCNSKNLLSEANGALMRCAPLALKFYKKGLDYLMSIAEEDCKITHPNKVCIDSNKIYLATMYYTLTGESLRNTYKNLISKDFSETYNINNSLIELVKLSTEKKPIYTENIGWVKIALQNALYHYWAETSFEEAMKETIYEGGDTDTNACICGGLIGLKKEIPVLWMETVKNCFPKNRPSWLHTSQYRELLKILKG